MLRNRFIGTKSKLVHLAGRVMPSFFRNWRGALWILSDRLRSYAAVAIPLFLAPARRILFLAGCNTIALKMTMLEHRLTSRKDLTAEIRARLPQVLGQAAELMNISSGNQNLHMRRALILRPPDITSDIIKKGVFLITFTETFQFFHASIDVEKLLRYFRIVLEPSWSGYCLPEILLWTRYHDPIIVQSSEVRDREFLKALGTCLVPTSIGASDWVDHRIFYPLNLPKDYDVIYVANLSPIKRVHVYLRSLKYMMSRGLPIRPALVLSSWGGIQSTFQELLDLYGLSGRIEVFMNLSQPELNRVLNRAKVSVLLSKKEGSNRTLFESMFADVPVLLLRDNIGVNKDYINQHTGFLVSEKELPEAIRRIGSMTEPLSPRRWAMANIAPEVTTRKLEALLAEQPSQDQVSTAPLWVKVNSPEAIYMDPTVWRLVPDIARVLDCFPLSNSVSEPISALDSRIRDLFRLS
jgi:glycosyltransferase involved in cell wall biosynthesis